MIIWYRVQTSSPDHRLYHLGKTKMDVSTLLQDDGHAFSQLQRASMKDIIAEKIVSLISTGLLSIGDELPSERELAAALSVSRETVRGALLILSTRGILSVIQGARTKVASCEVGNLAVAASRYRSVAQYGLEEVHATRLMIEAHVARAAAKNISDKTLHRLHTSIHAQESCLSDPVRFLICDREFHTTIYRACDNSLLAEIATDLYSYLIDTRRRIIAGKGSIAKSIADHKVILAGLERHDGDAVVRAFGIHENRIYKTTSELLSQAIGPTATLLNVPIGTSKGRKTK